jgi:predicted transcriptional regulator
MDVLYRDGPATVAAVRAGMPSPPSYSAVRSLLGVLETKGHVVHVDEDRAYLYRPTVARERARRSVLRHVVRTFFGGSAEATVAALVDLHAATLSAEELERLAARVDRARRASR